MPEEEPGRERTRRKEGTRASSSPGTKKGVERGRHLAPQSAIDAFEDSFHSDTDSVFDNVSFGEVALEEDYGNKEGADSSPEKGEDEEEEDEGHVDNSDKDIDDFMEEAFNDLEEEERGTESSRKPERFQGEQGDRDRGEGFHLDQDFVTIIPISFRVETFDERSSEATDGELEDRSVDNCRLEADKRTSNLLDGDNSGVLVSDVSGCPPASSNAEDGLINVEIAEDILDKDSLIEESCIDNSDSQLDTSPISDAPPLRTLIEIGSTDVYTSISVNKNEENSLADDLCANKGDFESNTSSPERVGNNIINLDNSTEIASDIAHHSTDEEGIGDKCLISDSLTLAEEHTPASVETEKKGNPNDAESQNNVTHVDQGNLLANPDDQENANIQDTSQEIIEANLKRETSHCASDDVTLEDIRESAELTEVGLLTGSVQEKGLSQASVSAEETQVLDSTNREGKRVDETKELNASFEYEEIETKLEISLIDKEIEVDSNIKESQMDGDLDSIGENIAESKCDSTDFQDIATNLEDNSKEEPDHHHSDNDLVEDTYTKSESSSVQFLSCERPSVCPSDFEEDEFDSAKEDFSDEEKDSKGLRSKDALGGEIPEAVKTLISKNENIEQPSIKVTSCEETTGDLSESSASAHSTCQDGIADPSESNLDEDLISKPKNLETSAEGKTLVEKESCSEQELEENDASQQGGSTGHSELPLEENQTDLNAGGTVEADTSSQKAIPESDSTSHSSPNLSKESTSDKTEAKKETKVSTSVGASTKSLPEASNPDMNLPNGELSDTSRRKIDPSSPTKSDNGQNETRRVHCTSEDNFLIKAVNSERLKVSSVLFFMVFTLCCCCCYQTIRRPENEFGEAVLVCFLRYGSFLKIGHY